MIYSNFVIVQEDLNSLIISNIYSNGISWKCSETKLPLKDVELTQKEIEEYLNRKSMRLCNQKGIMKERRTKMQFYMYNFKDKQLIPKKRKNSKPTNFDSLMNSWKLEKI